MAITHRHNRTRRGLALLSLLATGVSILVMSCGEPPRLPAIAESWREVVADGGPKNAKGPSDALGRAADTLAEARLINETDDLVALDRPWRKGQEMLTGAQTSAVDWFRHRGSMPGRTSPTRAPKHLGELGLLMLATAGFQANDAHVESALYLANRLADAGNGLADVEAAASIWDRATTLASAHDGTAWPELKVLAARKDALYVGLVRDIVARARRLTGEAADEFRAVTQPMVAALRPKRSEPLELIDALTRYLGATPEAARAFPVSLERLRVTAMRIERYRAYVNARL